MRTGADALRSLHHYVWKALEDDVPPVFQGEQRSWETRLWGTEGEFGFPFARIAAITPVSHSGPGAVREAARTFAVHLYPVPMGSPEDSILEAERVEEMMTVAFETGFTYTEPLAAPGRLAAALVYVGGALAVGTYSYVVTAVNATGESLGSVPVEIIVTANGGYVNLAWALAQGATSYKLYRTDPDLVERLIATVQGNSYVDAGDVVGVPAQPPGVSAALASVSTGPHRVPLYDYDGVPLDGVDSVSYVRGADDYLRVISCTINRIVDPEDDRYWLVVVEARVTWRRTGRVPGGTKVVQTVKLSEVGS